MDVNLNYNKMGNIKKERASNIEMLRLLAMFLVLIVHADFFSLGPPTQNDIIASPISAISRFFFQSLSIISVNVFVLISGWFGIRPNAKSFCNFIFQRFFFLVGIYIVLLICSMTSLSVKGIAGCLVMLKWNWFIKAYIGLYILSPVLNAFITNVEEKTFRKVLLGFFLFQTIYSWICGGAVFFESGYSTMSFIGLYLLARYVNIYLLNKTLVYRPFVYLSIFCVITILLTIISSISVRIGLPIISEKMYSYVNPLVIISSLSLLLLFNELNFKNEFINWCAASSFAIFLLHTNPNLCEPYFKPLVLRLYNAFDGVVCLWYLFLFLLAIGVAAILLDQIRKTIWNCIAKKYFD